MTRKRRRLSSMRALRYKLDRIFSAYIRCRDARDGGMGPCATCHKMISYRKGHCGHYIKRQHLGTRWDERNAALQCVSCNTYRGGAMDEFAFYLLRRYGPYILEELRMLKHRVWKPTREELLQLIERFSKPT